MVSLSFFFSRILRFFFLSHVLRFLLRSLVKVSFFLKKKLKVSLKDHNRFDIVKGKYQNDKTLFSLLLFCLPFFFISFLWVLCMGWVGGWGRVLNLLLVCLDSMGFLLGFGFGWVT